MTGEQQGGGLAHREDLPSDEADRKEPGEDGKVRAAPTEAPNAPREPLGGFGSVMGGYRRDPGAPLGG